MPVLAAAVLFVCFFSHLCALGLVGPDEPRYAAVARAMVETGDWVTPRLYGQPWFEKPALYYWGAAAAFRILGVSESAARLPSALAAALATLALAWAAWRLYGAAAGRAVLFILPTCVGSLAFARAATQDMLFSAALAAAMLTAHAVCSPVRSENFTESSAVLRKSLLGRFAFGFFLGVATLAKGPAGIALAGGSVALWALVSRRWREAFRLAHPLAIAAFCLPRFPGTCCALRATRISSARFSLLTTSSAI
jgi:4-amino-4-deoxy-L-arabinose transferase-like glycosyltransferase